MGRRLAIGAVGAIGLFTTTSCSVPRSDHPAPTQAAPELEVHLTDGGLVVASSNVPHGLLGIAETGAHEAGWFGEACSEGRVCHLVADKARAELRQVHHLDEVAPGRTLFDNHFPGKLTYYVEINGECWAGGHEPTWFPCAPMKVAETLDAPVQGHREPVVHVEPEAPIEQTAATVASEATEPTTAPPPELPSTSSPSSSPATTFQPVPEQPRRSKACCKRCQTGQPCGNSCIPWSHTCHSVGGCAC
jgi:hypothetical protein